MVDRHEILEGSKNVYIGDRGYCSYNNMAHVIEQDQFFLFRTKDIHSKGLVGNFDFPEDESFDINVKVTLVRSHSRKVRGNPDTYKRFVDQASTFDYIPYGSYETYELAFRIIRFPISESSLNVSLRICRMMSSNRNRSRHCTIPGGESNLRSEN